MSCPGSPAAVVRIDSESQLEEVLTRPSLALVEFIKTIHSPLLILGAGGKMGPTLAVLAKRAAQAAEHPLDIIAVSRFKEGQARSWLRAHGIQTVSADLLEANSLKNLAEAQNIIYLVGLKFGTAQNPAATWAMNTLVPARVAERYPRARIVALSTGNVYPLTEVSRGGALESNGLTPVGEYANAAVGRERIFEFCSTRQGSPVALLRLFYAVELRYGVVVDIARKVYTGEPIELANSYFNCIWQGDANERILRSLSLVATPPSVWNLCRPEVFLVRDVASRLGELLNKQPQFIGKETDTALLGNASRLCDKLGTPATELESLLHWVSHWMRGGGRNWGKPTYFEVRDGNY